MWSQIFYDLLYVGQGNWFFLFFIHYMSQKPNAITMHKANVGTWNCTRPPSDFFAVVLDFDGDEDVLFAALFVVPVVFVVPHNPEPLRLNVGK